MAVTDLITWDEVNSLLSIEEEYRQTAEFIIASASTQARRIMGRNICLASVEEQRHGTGGRSLLLREYPVKSVTAFYIDSSFLFGEETAVSSSDYYLDKSMGLIELYQGAFPLEELGRCVRIIYEAGFDVIPADIKQGILETVKWNLDRILYNGVGVKNEKVDGVSTSFEVRIPTNAREIFQSYRRANL